MKTKFHTIKLTEKHLQVIESALEAFTRMKLGQVNYALSEIFPNIDNEHRKEIYDFVRARLFPDLSPNASYGIGQNPVEWGNEAYEIRQTIRQYLAVKRNKGYFEPAFVTTDDPLKVTEEPLPIIPGFKKYKDFKVPKEIQKDLKILIDNKNYDGCWNLIENATALPRSERNQILSEKKIRCFKPIKP